MAAMIISFVSLGAGIRISMSLSSVGCHTARTAFSQCARAFRIQIPFFRSSDLFGPVIASHAQSGTARLPGLLLAICLWLVRLYLGRPGTHSIVEVHCKWNRRQRAEKGAERVRFQALRKQHAIQDEKA